MRRHNLSTLLSVVFTLAILAFGIGCKNHLLSQPTFGGSQNGTQDNQQTAGSAVSFGAPANLQSTQGGSREITLTWDPVKDAARYNVYRASTQFDTFVQVGEATSDKASYTMKVPAGADFYYRVTAVNYGGEESPFSSIVRGTALATPLISGIEGVEGKEDSDVTVYWYMGNVDAYQDQVRYNVICYDSKGSELARVVVDGSRSDKTEAVIPNLTPNTDYQYKVEAYLITAQDKVEAGDPMDAATARRLRPNAPEELKVEQGQSKDGITLTFKLPELVDVALPGGLYEQKPLYFKIYRRKFVEGSTDTEKGWELVKADFGKTTEAKEGEPQLVKFGAEDEEYTPGNLVTWTDTDKNLDRGVKGVKGVKYEYKVQSFAYVTNRDISSDLSTATNHGWLIAEALFETGTYTTVKDNAENPEQEATKNIAASLGFIFEFDTMGVEYNYILREEYWSLETYSADGQVETESVQKKTEDVPFSNVSDVKEYVRNFDLSQPDAVRGYYKYSLYILTQTQHEVAEAADCLTVLGDILVTDNISLPVIKSFSATSGYNNKIELSWEYNDKYIFEIKYKEDNDEAGGEKTIDHNTLIPQADTYSTGDEVTYTDLVDEGKQRTYILYAKGTDGGRTSSWPITARSSSTPAPELGDIQYGEITVKWPDVVADSYTISAQYQDAAVANANKIESGTITKRIPTALQENGQTYTFVNPTGYDNAGVSGLPIDVKVTANITPVKTKHTLEGEEGSSYLITEEKLTPITLEKTLVSRTMGPAATTVTVTQGGPTNTDSIDITWNRVEGATAYAIIRNRMHITGNKRSSFQSTDMYIVKEVQNTPTDGAETGTGTLSATVSLLGGTISEQDKVKVAVTPAADATPAKFTLTDTALTTLPAEPSGWETSQSQISWGAPYEYLVLPLINETDELQYDYSGGATNVTLAEIPLKQAKFAEGATSGYGWDVKATKGTYVAQGSTENTGVKVTWTNAWFSGDSYSLYRRPENGEWESAGVSGTSTSGIVDTTATPGVVYEYCVRPSGSPSLTDTYFAFAGKIMDEVYPTEKASVGFIMPKPSITSASRNKQKDAAGNWGVQIEWPASHVGSQVNRMLGGYVVEVYNPNKSSPTWEVVKKYTFGEGGFNRADGKFTQVVADYAKLEVKTQYRLYFRVRAFTENGDVLSKAESWTYSDGYNDTYVKWGARALTHEEFLWCASEVMRRGINSAVGSWTTQSSKWFEKSPSDMTGKIYSTSSSGVGRWGFVFNDISCNFMTIRGRLGADTPISNQPPNWYFTNMTGSVNGQEKEDWFDDNPNWYNHAFWESNYGTNYYMNQNTYNELVEGDDITVTGTPTDVESGMYNGNIQFIDVGTTSGGHIIVEVNGETRTLYGGFKKYTTLPSK